MLNIYDLISKNEAVVVSMEEGQTIQANSDQRSVSG